MSQEVIDMAVCPYCEKQRIEDNQYTCKECKTPFQIDMRLADLHVIIDELRGFNPSDYKNRKETIRLLLEDLNSFYSKIS
jgi:hypothetical protein